jgi:hypothetical protein
MIELAQQPLFRLLAAIIVLLIADMNPVYGLVALAVWIIWVYVSGSKFFVSKQ